MFGASKRVKPRPRLKLKLKLKRKLAEPIGRVGQLIWRSMWPNRSLAHYANGPIKWSLKETKLTKQTINLLLYFYFCFYFNSNDHAGVANEPDWPNISHELDWNRIGLFWTLQRHLTTSKWNSQTEVTIVYGTNFLVLLLVVLVCILPYLWKRPAGSLPSRQQVSELVYRAQQQLIKKQN